MEKTYTEDQVITIVANVMQNVTSKLRVRQRREEDSAKNYAINYVDRDELSDKNSSLIHLHKEKLIDYVVNEIKDAQYHLRIPNFLKSNKD